MPTLLLLILAACPPQQEEAPPPTSRVEIPALEPGPALRVPPSVLGQLEEELVALYTSLRPALVAVRVPVALEHEGRRIEQEILLSGVVLDGSGLFVAPGVDPGEGPVPESVSVTRYDGARFPARPVRHESTYGLTLYWCDRLGVPAPPLAACDALRVGSLCFAIGNAYELEGSFTLGVLAGRDRGLGPASGLLQITNPMNPGDGGGLLADRHGQVVGILLTSLREAARHQAGDPEGGLRPYRQSEQVAFAVPITTVRRIFAEELGYEPPPRPWVGMRVEIAPGHPLQGAGTSVLVAEVLPGSPAEQAGLRAGDILLSMDDQPLYSQNCLLYALGRAGRSARLQIWRGDQERWLTLRFPQPGRPAPQDTPRDGDRR